MTSDGVDTFSISTYTVEEGDVFSNDPEFNLLGSYMDPVFGEVSADFYTQLTLSGFDPDFEDLASLVVDSAVMAFEYGGYYGNLNEQLFEVYEITEDLHVDSNYVSTSTKQTAAQNLVPTVNNEGLITPNVELPVVVGNDTLDPQLRIPLDKTFAKQLLTYADGASSDEDFLNLFKGLHFKVNNGMMSSGEGSILYLATTRPNSKLTVYYTVNGAQAEYEFIVTGRAADYNHVVTDYSSTRVQQVINDSTSGNEEFYAQAFSTRAKIDFPSIKDLPENIIVHSAKLHLPIDYYGGSNFYPSTEVNVSSVLFNDDSRKYIVSSVIYDEFSKSYIVDLRTYIQNILKGEIQNNGLYVSPKKYNTTAERIVFNGVDTQNKSKPKLSIVYTEL
ncbi:hypothetical protein CW751_10980 [Brumimicrobium salinarum]|uniref:DUF4270 domain-containing protein n=2 Tax=Brumimicrobium salinarum TaxID=2058658 RepID=A0A2I0R0R6_9FLAO|nr:hypothetical protein CW751_10980 [Brumimicrobium salinarum]